MFTYDATLVRVVDGDTVDLSIDLGFHLSTVQRIRLLEIDTPERGEPGYKEAGLFVIDWFGRHDQKCIITTKKGDSFGRWLAHVWAAGEINSLNTALLRAGLATHYKEQ